MKVVHDELWHKCLGDTLKMYRITEPNDKCNQLADATWKMKKKYEEARILKNNRVTQLITTLPDDPRVQVKNSICVALTMSGSRCKFKAVCGSYCRNHNVSDRLKSQLV